MSSGFLAVTGIKKTSDNCECEYVQGDSSDREPTKKHGKYVKPSKMPKDTGGIFFLGKQ